MNKDNNPVSIVVPVYNEADTLPELFRRFEALFLQWPRERELIFVDDGSSDSSVDLLLEQQKKDPSIKIIRFARNFGQQAAITAGFEHTTHDIVVFIDSDLQVDPIDIPKLVEKIESGFDVVTGYRENRAEGPIRKLVSWAANTFVRLYFKMPYRDIGCGLQAFRKRYLEGPERFTTMYGHAAIFAVWRGGRFTDVVVSNHPRKSGRSKWGWTNLVHYFLDIIITFNISPTQLTVFFLLGSILFALGLFLFFLSLVLGVFSGHISILTFASALFFIIIGMQFVSLGFLNERISRIDRQIQKTPMFVIDEVHTPAGKDSDG